MAYRHATIAGIGEIVIYKRRRTANLRLSITSSGKVRVTIPYWAPYSAGVAFAKSRSDWLKKQVAEHTPKPLKTGDRIGKSYRLYFYHSAQPQPRVRLSKTRVGVSSSLAYDHPAVQKKAVDGCERALRKDAELLLPPRLKLLAKQYRFRYQSVRIKKLTARWGSCSREGSISLSYYLVQLPWHLIDYVIIHELVHTKHLHHGKDFWEAFEKTLPTVPRLRKEIHSYKPRIEPA